MPTIQNSPFRPVEAVAVVTSPVLPETPEPTHPLPPPDSGTIQGNAVVVAPGFSLQGSGAVSGGISQFVQFRSSLSPLALPVTARRPQ